MAPNSGRQQRGPGSMDPDWQTHESGGSGEQVLRAAPSSLPCTRLPIQVVGCMGASLERPLGTCSPEPPDSWVCQSGSMDPAIVCW